MSEQSMKSLEKQLTALTEWDGGDTEAWRAAMALAAVPDATTRSSVLARIMNARVPRPMLAVAAILTLCTAAAATIMLVQADNASRVATDASQTPNVAMAVAPPAADYNNRSLSYGNDNLSEYGAFAYAERRDLSAAAGRGRGGAPLAGVTGVVDLDSHLDQASDGERYVVRKATIELVAGDVRAAFLRAQHLVSAAEGEFVEASSLSGEDEAAQANLTLRVAVHRLPQVLNELRELGEVRAETATGDDVTSRIVDLDARLRNEQRIESELLDLVEKRTDAPLKEVLELRAELARVRTGIEQLAGQREHMARLVALASVLVIIRPETAETGVEPEESELGAFFSESIAGAWTSGLRILSNSLAWLVQTLVGGLIWWLVLIVLGLFVRRAWLRSPALLST